jgi:hypothetical protein
MGLADGRYKKNDTWVGFISAMQTYSEKESKGVGMQNFHYTPILRQFAEEVYCLDPSLYRNVLAKELPLPSERSIQ